MVACECNDIDVIFIYKKDNHCSKILEEKETEQEEQEEEE